MVLVILAVFLTPSYRTAVSSDLAAGSGLATSPFDVISSRVWDHSGLFWDPGYLSFVREHLNAFPWAKAWSEVKLQADDSLSFLPQPIRGSWSPPEYYADTAGYMAAVAPLEDSRDAMLWSADAYLVTHDDKYALNVVRVANAWTGSLMSLDSEQALYNAAWALLGMAEAAEMIHQFQGWDQGKRHAYISWLVERTNYLIGRTWPGNNLFYWRACLSMAVGVLDENTKLFDYAVIVAKSAIGNGIASDGHMPLETARGYRGIHYTDFAIDPLVFIAEMAHRQGIDLYSYQVTKSDSYSSYRPRNVSLKIAIDYLFKYLDKPSEWPWSSAQQDYAVALRNHFGWTELAYSHWRDPTLMRYLSQRRPIFDHFSGGMTTLTNGLPTSDDARRWVDMADWSIEKAAGENRTQGLDEAHSLFQLANAAMKNGNYTAAVDFAYQAYYAAGRAAKPTAAATSTGNRTTIQATSIAEAFPAYETVGVIVISLISMTAFIATVLTIRRRRNLGSETPTNSSSN